MLVLFLGPAGRGGGRRGEGLRRAPHGHGARGLGPNFLRGPWWDTLARHPDPRPTHCFSWASRSLTSASRLLTRITSSSSKSCSRLFCASVFCQSARGKTTQNKNKTKKQRWDPRGRDPGLLQWGEPSPSSGERCRSPSAATGLGSSCPPALGQLSDHSGAVWVFYFIWLYFTLFYLTLFYFILFYFTLFYFILLYFTLFHFISFHFLSSHFYFPPLRFLPGHPTFPKFPSPEGKALSLSLQYPAPLRQFPPRSLSAAGGISHRAPYAPQELSKQVSVN